MNIRSFLIILFIILSLLNGYLTGTCYIYASENNKVLSEFSKNIDNSWQEELNITTDINRINTFPEVNWWCKFNDNYLSDILDKTLRYNHDIKIAQYKIEQSSQNANLEKSKEYPQIYLRDLFARVKGSDNFLVPRAGQTSQQIQSFLGGGTQNLFMLPLSAQYELDYLGKNHLKTLSSLKQLEIAYLDYKTSKIVVTTDAATAYLNLIINDKLLCLNQRLFFVYSELLQIRKELYESGQTSIDKFLQTQSDLYQVQKNIDNIKENQSQIVHYLSIVQGSTPVTENNFLRGKIDKYTIETALPVGTPLELIRRRPDILAAEKLAEKSGLDLSVAKKEMFPDITVFGLFSYASASLRDLFSWSSNSSAIATILSQPIFTGGYIRSNIKLYDAKSKESFEFYIKTVKTALTEVEDGLVSIQSSYSQYMLSYNNIITAKHQYELAKDKYIQGYTSKIDMLEAEINLINLELELCKAKNRLFLDNISLYKVLGGGY